MLFSNIDILDENYEYQKNQFVGIKAGIIDYIGNTKPSEDYGETYEGQGKLLMPGMYNAHSHAPMTLLRGYAEGLPLDKWLNDMVFPFEEKITEERARPATDLAIAEMLRYGVVSFSDMYYFSNARSEAVIDSGVKSNISYGTLSFDTNASYKDVPAYAVNESLVKNYHGAGEGRLKIDVCIHAEYTNTEKVSSEIAAFAHDRGLNMHIHLSETLKEHNECKERRNGLTPAAYFEKCGVFDVPTVAAHCVYLEGDDFDILKEKGVTVATCPASNMKLASGFADIPQMLEKGIRVALGTDGVASNNNHNMFKEMYLLALLSKGHMKDPTLITPVEALRAATRSGALSQGREDCGVLACGMKADVIVLDVDVPHMSPAINPVNNVVYAAEGSDVCLTMVDGKVLYRDGLYTTIDVEKAMFETQAISDEIRASL